MAIIAKYKFNPSVYADYLPNFDSQFTGYTKTDVNNGDGTITRTISHNTLKPTYMQFGTNSTQGNRERSLLEVMECDTSEVTNMTRMFQECKELTSLNASSLNTGNVTTMQGMFVTCEKLTSLDLSSFNTSNVTNMSGMFNSCSKLTSLDLSNFDTSQVTDMTSMFKNCKLLSSLNLSNFNTGSVTGMRGMFSECKTLALLDISNFNTSKVTTMEYIFNSCTALSDIGLIYASSSTINSLLTPLGTSTARNIYYTDAPLNELTVQDNITYKKYEFAKATFPYTLNKLPNGVVDYIDVVNKVHVQRVGKVTFNGNETEKTWIKGAMVSSNPQKDILSRFYYDSKGYNDLKTSSSMIADRLLCTNINSVDRSETENVGHMGNAYFNIVIRKDRLATDNVEGFKTWLQSNPITILYELATPIYTPLTEEEIAQLPLSAYADGYVNLSSEQLTPSFEFRMKASNRYQVDMLETGYYYLNAPTGNVKLGTANVDVQQMPCIVKVDNVGTGDSGYRLGFDGGESIHVVNPTGTYGYWVDSQTGELKNASAPEKQFLSDFIEIDTNISSIVLVDDGSNKDVSFWDENKAFVKRSDIHNNRGVFKATIPNQPFKFIRIGSFDSSDLKARAIINPITLAKLPSHRIPTSFTQGVKCGTDFGYWEGIKESNFNRLWSTNSDWGMYDDTKFLTNTNVQLNRIEYNNNTIVEDELDIATGKLVKRIGKYTIDGNSNIWEYNTNAFETPTHMSFDCSRIPNFKKAGRCIGFLELKYGTVNSTISEECWNNLGVSDSLYFRFRKDRYSQYGTGADGVKAYFNANPTTIYYELEVPEISYLLLTKNIVKMPTNSKSIQINRFNDYLTPQVKPSHLTYPVPSLVGNRTYTVVHNRKNISGSTKPIELNLGGTVVQLNDASGKTLVKTPSTLAHNNLIFIGGESTVDHIMVLDGDWTNKPIEYFENMKGHDTDAIITIIGDGKIDDVAEKYLW